MNKDSLAVVISVISLVVAGWGAYTTNRNTQLALRPYVIAVPFLDGSAKKVGVYISNPGVGPAVLKDMTVTANGKSYSGLGRSKWSQFISDNGLTPDCFEKGWPPVGTVLKAGEEDPILAVGNDARPNCQQEMVRLLGGSDIHVHIEYSSIYGHQDAFDGSVHMNDDDAERAAVLLQQSDALLKQRDAIRSQLAKLKSEIDARAPTGDTLAKP